jgi:hypothetical protein
LGRIMDTIVPGSAEWDRFATPALGSAARCREEPKSVR